MIKYKYSGKSNLGNWHRYKVYLSIMISFWHFTAMIKPTTVAVAAWILDTHLPKKKKNGFYICQYVINTYTDINKAYLKLKLGFLFYGTQTQLWKKNTYQARL